MSNRFGGLGMIELNGMSLRDRLHHIRRFWGTQTKEYNWLKHAYETFLVDVGLGGNVVTCNYEALEFLTGTADGNALGASATHLTVSWSLTQITCHRTHAKMNAQSWSSSSPQVCGGSTT